MSQITEAACLLQSGRAYPRRIGLRGPSGELIFVGLRPEGFSIYWDDAPICHFDLEGRWQRAFRDGVHYLKGLDGVTRSVERPRVDGKLALRRQNLTYTESSDLDAAIRDEAIELSAGIDSGRLVPIDPPAPAEPIGAADLVELLGRVADWDAAAWFAHRERYAATYGPLPFLPPDLPNPVVLQKTLGHVPGHAFGVAAPWPRYVRSPAEFADHARTVRDLVGRRSAQGKAIFLAGTDLFHLPPDAVCDALATARDAFAHIPGLEIHAFLEQVVPPLLDPEVWKSYAQSGLTRVTLGLASGNPLANQLEGTPPPGPEAGELVAILKASPLTFGVAHLVGAGGKPAARGHVDDTAALVRSWGLGRETLVSLVDRRWLAGSAGEDALTDAEADEQAAGLRRGISGDGPSNGPRVIPYNPDKRWA
ncbi:hypothetical protein TA3x_005178 [Tundrisphaera sp. TA3]|uniref:hypothetical protein n=1 Tax=Tundrisphaera sp. TA3 TaxID=3435775 RepID=UPI003EBC503E